MDNRWSYLLVSPKRNQVTLTASDFSLNRIQVIAGLAKCPGLLLRLKFMLDNCDDDKIRSILYDMIGAVCGEMRSSEALSVISSIPAEVAASFVIAEPDDLCLSEKSGKVTNRLLKVINGGRIDKILEEMKKIEFSCRNMRLQRVIVFIYRTALSLLNQDPNLALLNMSEKVPTSEELEVLQHEFRRHYNAFRLLRGFAILLDQADFDDAANEFLAIEPCMNRVDLDFLMNPEAIAFYTGVCVLISRDWLNFDNFLDEGLYGTYLRASERIRPIVFAVVESRFDEAYQKLMALITDLELDIYFHRLAKKAKRKLVEKLIEIRMMTDMSINVAEIEQLYFRDFELPLQWIVEFVQSHSECIIDGSVGFIRVKEQSSEVAEFEFNGDFDELEEEEDYYIRPIRLPSSSEDCAETSLMTIKRSPNEL